MSDSKKMVKQNLLRRKINEFFGKNPSANSVIIKADVGGNKTHWKVTKEGKSYKILEVNTDKNEFTLEAMTPTLAGGGSKNPFQYDPDATPGMYPGKGGTQASAASGASNLPAWAKQVGKKDPNDPAQTVQQTMGQWDPNNPNGAFSKLVKTVGLKKAMMGMPDAELKRHFGLSKQSLKGKVDTKGATNAIQPEGKLNEATAEFAAMSREFTSAMAPPFNHTKLSTALKNINSRIPTLKDANERQQAGAMIGALTSLVDATTAGGGSPLTMGASKAGAQIKEDDSEKKNAESGVIIADTEPPAKEKPAISPVETHEDLIVSKTLAGQTIKDAKVVADTSGGSLTLDLVSVKVPVVFKWNNAGKITYYFKDRPYFLKR